MRGWIAIFALTSLAAAPVLAADAPAAPAGQATYERLCKSCHGDNGRGNPAKATALKLEPELLNLARPEALAMTREERRKVLLEGKGKMPAYGKKLQPADVDPLLDHVDALIAAPAK
jgi:mono/diheme cytochrome c family protein